MPEREGPAGQLTPAEKDVIKSFGWNVLASEVTLYERYLIVSARRSLSTLEEFQERLRDMEAKGFISSEEFHGQRNYRLLVAVDGLRSAAHPETPLDEMHLAIGTMKAHPLEKRTGPARVDSRVVSRSEYIGRQIQRALEAWMMRRTGKISKAQVNEHMENMWQALAISEEDLFKYVMSEIPGIAPDVRSLLRTGGPEMFLLGLRLADTATRKYR